MDKLFERYRELLQPKGLLSSGLLGPLGTLVNPETRRMVNTNLVQPVKKGVEAGVRMSPPVSLTKGLTGKVNAKQNVQDLRDFTRGVGAITTGPGALLAGGLFGGAASKLSGGSFSQGVDQGIASMQTISPITKYGTNPLISNYMSRLAPTGTLGKLAAGRLGQSVANVGEGVFLDRSMGVDTTAGSLALDAITGLAGSQFNVPNKPIGKGMDVGRNTKVRWDMDDVYELDGINDFLRRNTRNMTIDVLNEADTKLTYLARGYMPNAKINKLRKDYEGNDVGYVRALAKELTKLATKAENEGRVIRPEDKFTLDQIQMGFVGKDGKSQLRAARGFEQEMEAFNKRIGNTGKPKTKVPELEVSKQVQAEADINLSAEAKGGFREKVADTFAPIRNLPENTQRQFKDWVNTYNSREVSGVRAKQPFKKYDAEGMKAFDSIQQGSQGYKDLRNFFDDRYKKATKAGVEMNYEKNYLPQLWENTQEEIEKVFGQKLGLRPGFTMEKVIKDYKTGIKAGLTPKYTKVSDLAGWYETATQKAIADRKLFDYMRSEALIQPSNKAPSHWVTLAPDAFPKYKVKTPEGMYNGTYSAPPELAGLVNNQLNRGSKLLETTARMTSAVKGVILSAGVPGTGLTFHTFNNIARQFMSAKNPFGAVVKGGWWALNPKAAGNYVNSRLDRLEFFAKNGMTASTEDQAFTRVVKEVEGNILKKGVTKLTNWQQKMFEDNVFRKVIPAMKLDFADNLYKDLKNQGLDDATAGKQASQMANEFFAGVNTAELGRSKDLQNFLRSSFLASDWMESNVRLGRGAVRAVTPGLRGGLNEAQKMVYTRMIRNIALAYISANVANKMMSDKWLWENEKGNEFNIDSGQYTANGKKIYIRPFGTGMDFVRLPYEIARDAMSGDFSTTARAVKNRLSPLAGFGVGVVTDQDYRGRAIGWRGKDKYGNEMSPLERAGGITNEFLGLGTPSYVRAPIDMATGRIGAEEGIAQSLELPLRFTGGAYSASQKQAQELFPDLKGKDRYDINQKLKGQSKFGDNQVKLVSSKGQAGIDEILKQRENTRLESEAKKRVEETGETTETAEKIFYFDTKTDEIKSIRKDRDLTLPKLTGEKNLDDELLSDYYAELGRKKNDIIEMAKLGLISAKEAESQIVELDEYRKGVKSMYSKSGGTKVKKLPAGAFKSPPKIKVARVADRDTSIKVSKINVNPTRVSRIGGEFNPQVNTAAFARARVRA